ncbi:MAG: HD-GYP domain-containing protein [Solirubrobacteraceae bacterium]
MSGVAIVTLIVVALGISLWQSQKAARLASDAIADQRQLTVGSVARDLLFDETNLLAADHRLSSTERAVVNADQAGFTRALTSAARSADSHEAQILRRVLVAAERLGRQQHVAEMSIGGPRGPAALRLVAPARHTVDQVLDEFVAYNTRDAGAAQARSRAATEDARTVGIAVGVVAVLAAILLVTYVISLLRRYSARIRTDAGLLEQKVRDVEDARLETLQRLALAGEYRDDDTMHHTERVGVLAAEIATRMGLASETVETIRLAAPMHDIGKLGVSDTILLKPGRLTPEEREAMERHTLIGASILAGSRSPVLQLAQQIALSHHERWDANGYPHGLDRDAIPIAARIVAVADVYDALTHERPYKHAWPPEQALIELKQQAGSQFDPQVVAAFLSSVIVERDASSRELQRHPGVLARPIDGRDRQRRPEALLLLGDQGDGAGSEGQLDLGATTTRDLVGRRR